MIFGTWNVRSLCRVGSLMAAARELMFKKWDMRVWTGLGWLRVETVGWQF
jgi:hypothetical protein